MNKGEQSGHRRSRFTGDDDDPTYSKKEKNEWNKRKRTRENEQRICDFLPLVERKEKTQKNERNRE
jgi:hypothetical protein